MSKFVKQLERRLNKKPFWVMLFAWIPVFAEAVGMTQVIPSNYDALVTATLGLLTVLLGWNDPTTPGLKDREDLY